MEDTPDYERGVSDGYDGHKASVDADSERVDQVVGLGVTRRRLQYCERDELGAEVIEALESAIIRIANKMGLD